MPQYSEKINALNDRWLEGFKLFAERAPKPKKTAWRTFFQSAEEVVRSVANIPEVRNQNRTGGVMVLINTGYDPLISAYQLGSKGREKIPILDQLKEQWVDKNLAVALGQALVLNNYPEAQTSGFNHSLPQEEQLTVDGEIISGGAFRINYKGQDFILSFSGFGAELDEVVVLTAARIFGLIDIIQAKNLAEAAGNNLYLDLARNVQ